MKHVSALQIKTSVWQGGNKYGEEGVHLSSLRTDTPRSLKTLMSETTEDLPVLGKTHNEPQFTGKTKSCGE